MCLFFAIEFRLVVCGGGFYGRAGGDDVGRGKGGFEE